MRDMIRRALVSSTPVLPPYAVQYGTLPRAVRGSLVVALVLLLGAIYGFVFALSTYLVMVLLAPLGLLLGAVIWALPDYDHPPVELIRKLFFGAVIVMLLWPNYVAIAIPGLPWISFQRVFLMPLCLALLVSLSVSEKFRAEMKAILSAAPLLWKMLAAFVMVQCLSLGMAYGRVFEALKDLFNYQVVWTAMFFASAFVFRDVRNIRLWFGILFVAAMILTLVGAFEAINRQTLWASHVPSFLKMDSAMIDMILRGSARADAYRVQATFSTSLACAEFLALATPIVVHGFMSARRLTVKGLCLLADLAILATIMETQSRLGLIGFLAGHAFYLGAFFVRLWRHNRASIVGPAFTLAYPAALVLLISAVFAVHAVSTRVLGGGETHASNVSREAQWHGALRILAQSPLFGHGPHGGAVALDFHDPTGMLTLDSYLLTMLLDYGVAGFLLFYGMIIHALVMALELGMRSALDARAFGLPIATALVIFLTTRAVLSQEDNNAIAFMLMGMTMALLSHDAERRAQRPG